MSPPKWGHSGALGGLHAKYTISTYITFERSVVAKTLKPVKNSDGKPLTTVNITYRAP